MDVRPPAVQSPLARRGPAAGPGVGHGGGTPGGAGVAGPLAARVRRRLGARRGGGPRAVRADQERRRGLGCGRADRAHLYPGSAVLPSRPLIRVSFRPARIRRGTIVRGRRRAGGRPWCPAVSHPRPGGGTDWRDRAHHVRAPHARRERAVAHRRCGARQRGAGAVSVGAGDDRPNTLRRHDLRRGGRQAGRRPGRHACIRRRAMGWASRGLVWCPRVAGLANCRGRKRVGGRGRAAREGHGRRPRASPGVRAPTRLRWSFGEARRSACGAKAAGGMGGSDVRRGLGAGRAGAFRRDPRGPGADHARVGACLVEPGPGVSGGAEDTGRADVASRRAGRAEGRSHPRAGVGASGSARVRRGEPNHRRHASQRCQDPKAQGSREGAEGDESARRPIGCRSRGCDDYLRVPPALGRSPKAGGAVGARCPPSRVCVEGRHGRGAPAQPVGDSRGANGRKRRVVHARVDSWSRRRPRAARVASRGGRDLAAAAHDVAKRSAVPHPGRVVDGGLQADRRRPGRDCRGPGRGPPASRASDRGRRPTRSIRFGVAAERGARSGPPLGRCSRARADRGCRVGGRSFLAGLRSGAEAGVS